MKFCLASLLILLGTAPAMHSFAAQDEPKQDTATDSQKEATATGQPPMQGDEVPGMEPAPSVPATETGATTAPRQQTPPEKSYLTWMIESSGLIGFVLFAMSFLTVGLTIKFILDMQ